MPIPDLDFPYPDCTICQKNDDMNTDSDSWWCEDCGSNWDRMGEHGEGLEVR